MERAGLFSLGSRADGRRGTRFPRARHIRAPGVKHASPDSNRPESDLDEDDLDNPSIPHGTITIRNTGFKPWTADNLKARTTLDLNVGYQLTRRLSLAGSVNNVFNVVPLTNLQYAPDTPAYARRITASEYGVAFAVGLKGTF